MTNLIKSINYNRELDNAYILVELEDKRSAIVQIEKETNKLHAAYNDYSICIDSNASDDNDSINEDDGLASKILTELRKRFSEEVKDFEEVFSLEIEKYLKS